MLDSITYIKDWGASANDWLSLPEVEATDPLKLVLSTSRCYNIIPAKHDEELLPSFDAVVKSPCSGGL